MIDQDSSMRKTVDIGQFMNNVVSNCQLGHIFTNALERPSCIAAAKRQFTGSDHIWENMEGI